MIRLREMTADDWPAVEKIYAQGIEDGEATFRGTALQRAQAHDRALPAAIDHPRRIHQVEGLARWDALLPVRAEALAAVHRLRFAS